MLRYNLCLNEKLEIATHQQKNLRNKGSELVSKCRNFNKLLPMILESDITWWQATDVPFSCLRSRLVNLWFHRSVFITYRYHWKSDVIFILDWRSQECEKICVTLILVFFKLPKDPEEKKLWISKLKHENLLKEKNIYVCYFNFDINCFKRDFRVRLFFNHFILFIYVLELNINFVARHIFYLLVRMNCLVYLRRYF